MTRSPLNRSSLTRISSVLMLASIALVLTVATAPMAGCFGTRARSAALPVMDAKAVDILQEARAGADLLPPAEKSASLTQIDAFASAMASRDKQRVTTEAWPAWPTVKLCAETWIAGELQAARIGPRVSESLRERLKNYYDVLRKIALAQ